MTRPDYRNEAPIRFMINLRSVDPVSSEHGITDTKDRPHFSTPISRVPESFTLGNIGEDLGHGDSQYFGDAGEHNDHLPNGDREGFAARQGNCQDPSDRCGRVTSSYISCA